MKVVAVIQNPEETKRILLHLEKQGRAPKTPTIWPIEGSPMQERYDGEKTDSALCAH